VSRQLGLDLEAPRVPTALSSFYIRSEMPLAEALDGQKRAATQETVLLAWLQAQPGKRFAPSEVHTGFPHWPLTSCRRALTNLAKRGDLIHHEKDRREGPFGSPESTWSAA
jgi:hypothetical protein